MTKDYQDKASLPKLQRPLPAEGSVYDWVFNPTDGDGRWVKWMATAGEQKISADAEYSQIIVTTVDVVGVV